MLHQTFDRIIMVHNNCNSREYENIDCEYYDEIQHPNDEEFDLVPSIKQLIIFKIYIIKHYQKNSVNG